MQVSNIQHTVRQTQNATNQVANTEGVNFDDVLNETSSVSDTTEPQQRIYFDLSYENVKGMTDEEIEKYFPFTVEDKDTYRKMTDADGNKYIPYTPEEKRDNIRYMRDMAAGFSDNDAVNKAIFEEAKHLVGKAKVLEKEDTNHKDSNPNGFNELTTEQNNKLRFSLDLFRAKMDFGLKASDNTGALTDNGSIGFNDPNPTKTWKLDDNGNAYDYGFHNIGKESEYAITRGLASGDISLNPGQPLDPENTKVYTNEKLTEEQAVQLLTSMLKVSQDMLAMAKDEDEIKHRQSAVDKYTRMFDTYQTEVNKTEESENRVILNQYTRNNRPNPIEN